jgi:hypothetical protein
MGAKVVKVGGEDPSLELRALPSFGLRPLARGLRDLGNR